METMECLSYTDEVLATQSRTSGTIKELSGIYYQQ